MSNQSNYTRSANINQSLLRIATNVVFHAEERPGRNPLAPSTMEAEEQLIAMLRESEQDIENLKRIKEQMEECELRLGISNPCSQDVQAAVDERLSLYDEMQEMLAKIRQSARERDYWKHKYEQQIPVKLMNERHFMELVFGNLKTEGGNYEHCDE